jgi:hypothetical protein
MPGFMPRIHGFIFRQKGSPLSTTTAGQGEHRYHSLDKPDYRNYL